MFRALQFAATSVCLGLLLSLVLARRNAHPLAGPSRALLLAQGCALAAVAAQLAAIHAHGLALVAEDLEAGSPWLASTQTWVGRLFWVQGLVLIASGLLTWRRPAHLAACLGLVASLLLTGMTGHAVSGGASPALSVAALVHVLLAGLWLGGLASLLADSGSASALRAALARFSRVALPGMAGVLLTGSLLATWSVDGWPALFATPYGWTLLFKLACVALVLALALRLRQWLHRPEAALRPRRWLWAELACASGVVAAAGCLSTLVPARHMPIEWPFAFRFDAFVAWQAKPDLRPAMLAAVVALAVGLAFAASLAWRGRHRLAFEAILVAGVVAAALGLPSIALDASPFTYRATPARYDAISLAEGARLYARHCVACHGAQGRGDGPLAQQLQPAPADLTQPHVGWHTRGDLYGWLTEGYPNSPMPGFAEVTTDLERWQMVNHLIALSFGHQARSLPERPVERQPWLPAIDFRFKRSDGGMQSLSELRPHRAAFVVVVHTTEELHAAHMRAVRMAGVASALARIVVVFPPELAASWQRLPVVPGVDAVADAGGEAARAWSYYRRTLATPDFRDEQVEVPRLEFLVDRFGFVRARWRSDEGAGGVTPEALLAMLRDLADEPELRSPEVHGHE